MVVEWISARPIDEANVRIHISFAIELERLPGLQEHVCDSRYRNRALRRIGAARHFRRRQINARVADAVDRAVTKRETAAWQTDVSEHRCERDRSPVRLFAAMRPLQ